MSEDTRKENEKKIKGKSKKESKKNIEKKSKVKNKELKIAVIIGPEGGINQEEIIKLESHNAKIITLGTRILRTETVALNMLSIIMYELEMDWKIMIILVVYKFY